MDDCRPNEADGTIWRCTSNCIALIIQLIHQKLNEITTNNTNKSSTAITHIDAFFKTHDVIHVAENAVFKILNTGQETIGREAIGQMLHFYHTVFDARAIINNIIITDKKAVLEATFSGRHIGEFANIPPNQERS